MLRKIFLPGLLLALLTGVLCLSAEATFDEDHSHVVSGNLNSMNDANVYTFTVPSTGRVVIWVTSDATQSNPYGSAPNYRLTLYDSNSTYTSAQVRFTSNKENLFTDRTLSPGTYSVKVSCDGWAWWQTTYAKVTYYVHWEYTCLHRIVSEHTVPATCTTEGAVNEACDGCGKVFSTLSTIPMLPHEYHDEDWSVLIPATCTATGVDSRRCRNCTATQERESALRPHPYGEWVTDVEPTCTASGSHTHVCTVCGHEETQAMAPLPHPYEEWVVLTEPTCTTGGQRMRVCPACNKTDLNLMPALGHDYGAWAVTAYPSCTAPGASSRTCGVCSYVQEQAIDQLDHVYDSWQTIAAPTAGEAGQESGHCAVCGGDYVQAIPLRADYMAPMGNAHKLWWTCTEDGILSLTGQVPAEHAVLAGVYDGDALTAVRLLMPGTSADLGAPAAHIRLFWLDQVQTPQCPRVDVEKHPVP